MPKGGIGTLSQNLLELRKRRKLPQELLQIAPGEALLLLGEEDNGLALVRREKFLSRFQRLW